MYQKNRVSIEISYIIEKNARQFKNAAFFCHSCRLRTETIVHFGKKEIEMKCDKLHCNNIKHHLSQLKVAICIKKMRKLRIIYAA